MSVPDAGGLPELALKLGRPANAFASLARLTPEQMGHLVDAIDAAAVRQRARIAAALKHPLLRLLRPLLR